MKKLLPPAYQDRGGLTRLHPLWLEPPTIRGLASEHLSAPAPWLHIYEGQLPVPSAPTCSPTLPGHGGGSGQLSGAHFSPPPPPPPPPRPGLPPKPPRPPFFLRGSVWPPSLPPCPSPPPSAGSCPSPPTSPAMAGPFHRPCQPAAWGGGSTDNKGRCHGNQHFPREIFCLGSFVH